MTNPKLIPVPFASTGDKANIPDTSTDDKVTTMQSGFPLATEKPISEGGVPPERDVFNAILNIHSENISHLNKGLPYEYNADFAFKIGGYPLHARIMKSDGEVVQNTLPNNTADPNTNMTGWKMIGGAHTDAELITENGQTQREVNKNTEKSISSNSSDINLVSSALSNYSLDIIGRRSSGVCNVYAPPSAPNNAGWSQSLFYDDKNKVVYVTFDPNASSNPAGDKYIGKYSISTGQIISETVITDARVGHLDSIFVDGGGFIFVAGSGGNPAILKINPSTGAVEETIDTDMSHTGAILLAVNPLNNDEFVLWGKFNGSSRAIIVSGKLSDAKNGIVIVRDTNIVYEPAVLQGLAYFNDSVYCLSYVQSNNLNYLRQYSIRESSLISETLLEYKKIYSNSVGKYFEPEGLCISIDNNSGGMEANIYYGIVLGDGTKTGGFTNIVKYHIASGRDVFSSFAYAGRSGENVKQEYSLLDINIKLVYSDGSWIIESGDGMSSLTRNSISSIGVSSDNLNIEFNLNYPYQDVLSWSCNGSNFLIQSGKATPVWVYKSGGGSSNQKQQIRFVNNGSYVAVNNTNIQNGMRLCLNLKVII